MSLRQRFLKNKCRICKKTFCCMDCRLKHEETRHAESLGCEICFEGRVPASGISTDKLREHIKLSHWPLHCLLCKTVFGSYDELGIKCPLACPKVVVEMEEEVASPSAGNAEHFAFTSTPMLRDGRYALDKFPETITPVDCNDKKAKIKYANEYLSSCTIPDKGKETVHKRRVTFSETPVEYSIDTKYETAIDHQTPRKSEESAENVCNEHKALELQKSQHLHDSLYQTVNDTLEHGESNGSLWDVVRNVVVSLVTPVPNRKAKKRPSGEQLVPIQLKRIKLTDIKCRPPISAYRFGKPLVPLVDKSTQTEFEIIIVQPVKSVIF